jgi:biopolymer transport protein TolR
MAMLIRSGSRNSRRRQPMADINVTPMVDVMLVLLVVFMITAPMLTTGVAVDLPKTKAQQLPAGQKQPLVVSVDKKGLVYVGTQPDAVEMPQLGQMLKGVAGEDLEKRVFVRADTLAPYGEVLKVLAAIQGAGFKNVALPADPKVTVQALEEAKTP